MSAMTALLDSVAPAEQQAVEVGAASTEQRTAEVLAALNRLWSDEVIALDDVLYVADGCVTYVSFGPVASVPPPVLALTVNRPYALAVEVERPTRHAGQPAGPRVHLWRGHVHGQVRPRGADGLIDAALCVHPDGAPTGEWRALH